MLELELLAALALAVLDPELAAELAAAELAAALAVLADPLLVADGPAETGVGVGEPGARAKFAQARMVRSDDWMTMLRLPKKELRPGSVEV